MSLGCWQGQKKLIEDILQFIGKNIDEKV